MNKKSEEISRDMLLEMQENQQKLQNGVLLSPEEYAALLQLLAQAELQKQQQRMGRNTK